MKFLVPFVLVPFTVLGFNLETRLPIIKTGRVGSYFGYSVAEHQSIGEISGRIEQNWLLVGAPLDENSQPQTNRSGALWKCPITTRSNDCIQVVTDGKRTIDSTKLMPPLDDEIKDGQWMGVTVKSNGPGGKVLVCAHRYVRRGSDFQWGHGLCYTLTQLLDYDSAWEPCKGLPTQRAHEDYGYCQAGTSGLLLDDDMAMIGTPGPLTWRGTVFVVSVSDDYLLRDKTLYHGPLNETTSEVDKYSYLGMSVTGAKFFGNHTSFAAGAPRSNGTGQVYIFSIVKRSVKLMRTDVVIDGEQFGSSFGYEITSADLNGDGLPELIVGAPFYFSKDTGGAVYIYYNNKEGCLNCAEPQKFVGVPESRFGFAITSLGDLNQDGYDDLAIGAPYDGTGAVFIYLGSSEGLIKEPTQVIRASQIDGVPKTLGYSLSGKLDLDLNGYPDLLIGAYESDKVVLIRARPIIDITTEVTPEANLKNIDPTKKGCAKDSLSEFTCFSFEACCQVPNSTIDRLNVLYRIEAETFQAGRKFSRVWFGPDNTTRPNFIQKNMVLRRNQNGLLSQCEDMTVYVKENTRDIQSPIRMKLSYSLVQSEPVKPRPGSLVPGLDNYPILNQQEAAKTFQATFQKDCGTNDVCESNLHTSAVLLLPRDTEDDEDYILLLGSTNELQVNVTVENTGESAYETLLFVRHPKTVSFIGISTQLKQLTCHPHNTTLVICNIGNPFKKLQQSEVQLRFDPQKLGDDVTHLQFVIFANSTSFETEIEDPVELRARISKRAEVSLRGSSRPEQVFYGGIIRGESAMIFKDDIGTKVVHTYQVYNEGPWRLNNLEIRFKWPFQVANSKPQGKWLLYLDEYPIVDALGGGKCFIRDEDINPLRLDQRPGLYDYTTESTTASSVTFNSSTPGHSASPRLKRRRRDQEVIVRAEKIVDSEGRKHTVVNMNCSHDPLSAKCLHFKCVVYNLKREQEATVRISARLWNATLVEDYPRIDYVKISSYARIVTSSVQDKSDDEATVTTIAYPEMLEGAEPEDVPIWIMIVATVAGLLLLLLIILVLWKIGFFKRSRPDPTLSGNLTKASEDDIYS